MKVSPSYIIIALCLMTIMVIFGSNGFSGNPTDLKYIINFILAIGACYLALEQAK